MSTYEKLHEIACNLNNAANALYWLYVRDDDATIKHIMDECEALISDCVAYLYVNGTMSRDEILDSLNQ